MSITISAQRIVAGSADASRRCASTTGSPKQSSPSKVTSPTEMPTRTWIRSPSLRRLRRSISCWIATAAATAPAALGERGHQPVAEVLDDLAAVRGDGVAEDLVVDGAKHLGGVLADP